MASLAVLVGAIVTFIVLLLIGGAGYLVSDTLISKTSVRQRFVPFSRAQSLIVITVPLCIILGYYRVGGCKACGLWYALSISFHVMGLYSLKYAFLERVIFSADPPKAREEQSAEEARKRREADRKAAKKKRVGKAGHKSRRGEDADGGLVGPQAGMDGAVGDAVASPGRDDNATADGPRGSGEGLLATAARVPTESPNEKKARSSDPAARYYDPRPPNDDGRSPMVDTADRLEGQHQLQGFAVDDGLVQTDDPSVVASTLIDSGGSDKGSGRDEYDDESVEESSSSLPTVDYTQETTEAAIYGQMDIQKGTWKEEYVRKDVYEAKVGAQRATSGILAIPEDGEVDNADRRDLMSRPDASIGSDEIEDQKSSARGTAIASGTKGVSAKLSSNNKSVAPNSSNQTGGSMGASPNNESTGNNKSSLKTSEDSQSNSGSGLSGSLSHTSKRIQRKLQLALVEQNGWQLTGAKLQRISLGTSCVFVVLIMCFLIQAQCGDEKSTQNTGCNIRYHYFIGVFGCVMLSLDCFMFYQYSTNILSLLNRMTKVDQEKVELVKSDLWNQAKWTMICLFSCFVDTLIGTFWISFDNLTLVCLDAIVVSLANIIMFANPN